MYTVRDVQARLNALGFNVGPVDGMRGRNTRRGEVAALASRGGRHVSDLFDLSGIHRVHWHWTAGAYGIIGMERRAYNGLIDQHGNRHDGEFSFATQAKYRVGHAASHTRMFNTGAIGLSCDAMHGANERPFRSGDHPLTWEQLWAMCEWTAEICAAFDIPITKWSTVSHAEIQPTFGVRQNWKWDFKWLPDMADVGDPVKVGDRLRGMTKEKYQELDIMT